METPRRRSLPRLTPVAPWPAVGSVDEYVRTEQVRLVYRQAVIAQVIVLMVAALVAAALWRVSDHGRLVGWLAVLVPVTLARSALVLAYRRRNPERPDTIAWEWRFLISLTASSLAWGVGGLWIMPPDSLAHQALIYFFLIGIAGGAVASYAAHRPATVAAIAALMVPVTLWFALQHGLEQRAMAIGGLFYLGISFRATREFGSFLRRTFELTWELQQAHALAHKLARTDDLTGLDNRRAFTEAGRRALDQARRYERPLALIMFDIDHFKRINDSYGHAAGDQVLQTVAAVMRRQARAADITGRLGGEEFALLLPETAVPDAVAFAERLRGELAATSVPHDGGGIAFTCSFGVAALDRETTNLDALLSFADKALYRAKGQGRNRVSKET